MSEKGPGDGFLGWLGRQIGHVTKAVKEDVTKPKQAAPLTLSAGAAESTTAGATPSGAEARTVNGAATTGTTGNDSSNATADPAPEGGGAAEKVVYREERAEELPHPQEPGMVLRRTTIDEVIVKPQE